MNAKPQLTYKTFRTIKTLYEIREGVISNKPTKPSKLTGVEIWNIRRNPEQSLIRRADAHKTRPRFSVEDTFLTRLARRIRTLN